MLGASFSPGSRIDSSEANLEVDAGGQLQGENYRGCIAGSVHGIAGLGEVDRALMSAAGLSVDALQPVVFSCCR